MNRYNHLESREELLYLIELVQQLIKQISYVLKKSNKIAENKSLLDACLLAHDIFSMLDRHALHLDLKSSI